MPGSATDQVRGSMRPSPTALPTATAIKILQNHQHAISGPYSVERGWLLEVMSTVLCCIEIATKAIGAPPQPLLHAEESSWHHVASTQHRYANTQKLFGCCSASPGHDLTLAEQQ